MDVRRTWRLIARIDESADLWRSQRGDYQIEEILNKLYFNADSEDRMIGKADGQFLLDGGTYSQHFILNLLPKDRNRYLDTLESGLANRCLFARVSEDAQRSIPTSALEDVIGDSKGAPMKAWNLPKSADLEQRRFVTLSDSAKSELQRMAVYGAYKDRVGPDGTDTTNEDIRQWLRFTHGESRKLLLRHVAVRLERLTILLYRHDGGKLTGDVTVVPDQYFEDAKRFMQFHADGLRELCRDRIEEHKEAARRREEEAARLSLASQQALKKETAEEWITKRLEKYGGLEPWGNFYNAARSLRWAITADIRNTMDMRQFVDKLPIAEVTNDKPAYIRLVTTE